MKRAFITLGLSLVFLGTPLMAQDTGSAAAAVAARQDADERYKRMAADLQAVQTDNEALHAKISALEQEIQSLRDTMAKSADNSGVQDQLKHLADKIQEVDQKRLADHDAISEEIRNSIRGLETSSPAISEPPHSTKAKPSETAEAPPVDGYSYVIKDGDTLGAILKAYNADFKSKGLKPITMHQAEVANPTVNWKRLLVGQKIVIPRPSGG